MEKICKNCKYWFLCTETTGFLLEDKCGRCAQIHEKIEINLVTGYDGAYVGSIETNALFGCVLFEERKYGGE